MPIRLLSARCSATLLGAGGLSSSTLMTFFMSFAEEAVGEEEFVLEMD